MGRLVPRGHRARPVRFVTWFRVGGAPAQLGTRRVRHPHARPPAICGAAAQGSPGTPTLSRDAVVTLSQLCPQRGPSWAASAGPRAAPRLADVTSVLFKARSSAAATALTERRPPPLSSPASCPRQPLLSPSPALVPSSRPFSGLPVCTLGQGGVAACGLCIWLHSAVASPVPGTIRGEQVPTLAVCVPAVTKGAAEDVRVGLSRDRSSVRPRQCARSPRRWPTHGVTSLLSRARACGAPPPRSRGLGGTPSD